MGITVNHPTERPNFAAVVLNGYTFWFSYTTCIAFTNGDGIHISENCWGPTTGKHLNWIDADHKVRLPRDKFEAMLDEHLEDVDDALLAVRKGATPAQIDHVIGRLRNLQASLEN